MKKALKTIGMVIAAILIFVFCQVFAGVIGNWICLKKGIPADSSFNSMCSTYIGDLIYIIGALFGAKFGKTKSLSEGMQMRKVSPIVLLIVPVFAIGVKLMTSTGMALMPLPEELFEATGTSAQTLYEIPTWLQFIGAVVLAPLSEEILYRGIVQTRVSKAYNAVLGIIVSSVMFGIAHSGSLLWTVWAALMGLAIAFLRYKTNSIIPCIVFHSTSNLVSTLAANGMISMPSNIPVTMVVTSVISIICAAAIVKVMAKRNNNIAQTAS
jgi:membrane protease YdiL (CAAX protease family)